jgi:hypothetical protein
VSSVPTPSPVVAEDEPLRAPWRPPPPPPPPPPRWGRWLRRLLFAVLLALLGLLAFLIGSERGLRYGLVQLERLTGGMITVGRAEGRLLDRFELHDFRYAGSDGTVVSIRRVLLRRRRSPCRRGCRSTCCCRRRRSTASCCTPRPTSRRGVRTCWSSTG